MEEALRISSSVAGSWYQPHRCFYARLMFEARSATQSVSCLNLISWKACSRDDCISFLWKQPAISCHMRSCRSSCRRSHSGRNPPCVWVAIVHGELLTRFNGPNGRLGTSQGFQGCASMNTAAKMPWSAQALHLHQEILTCCQGATCSRP